MSTYSRFFLCLCLLVSLLACRTDSDQLTPSEMQHVDTLYSRQIRILAPELDSLCDLHMDSLVRLAADSMIELRIKEMENILNRQ